MAEPGPELIPSALVPGSSLPHRWWRGGRWPLMAQLGGERLPWVWSTLLSGREGRAGKCDLPLLHLTFSLSPGVLGEMASPISREVSAKLAPAQLPSHSHSYFSFPGGHNEGPPTAHTHTPFRSMIQGTFSGPPPNTRRAQDRNTNADPYIMLNT